MAIENACQLWCRALFADASISVGLEWEIDLDGDFFKEDFKVVLRAMPRLVILLVTNVYNMEDIQLGRWILQHLVNLQDEDMKFSHLRWLQLPAVTRWIIYVTGTLRTWVGGFVSLDQLQEFIEEYVLGYELPYIKEIRRGGVPPLTRRRASEAGDDPMTILFDSEEDW